MGQPNLDNGCLHDYVTDTPSTDYDGAWMMGLRTTSYKLGGRSDELMIWPKTITTCHVVEA